MGHRMRMAVDRINSISSVDNRLSWHMYCAGNNHSFGVSHLGSVWGRNPICRRLCIIIQGSIDQRSALVHGAWNSISDRSYRKRVFPILPDPMGSGPV